MDELLEQLEGIALVLFVMALLALAYAAEIWPITLPILIFAIGSMAYIAYCRGWWLFGIRRKNKKAVDPPDNGPGSLH